MKKHLKLVIILIILTILLSSAVQADALSNDSTVSGAMVDHSEMVNKLINDRSNVLVIAGSVVLLLTLMSSDYIRKKALQRDTGYDTMKRRERNIKLILISSFVLITLGAVGKIIAELNA